MEGGSCSLFLDAPGQLDILWHDGDLLRMDGTQVRILKQSYNICVTVVTVHGVAGERDMDSDQGVSA